jgi:hypothetical protein
MLTNADANASVDERVMAIVKPFFFFEKTIISDDYMYFFM